MTSSKLFRLQMAAIASFQRQILCRILKVHFAIPVVSQKPHGEEEREDRDEAD
jgi:hypothetical protein